MSNLQMYPGNPRGENQAEEQEIGAGQALWTFFSSMKTAIWLLLILAAASIAGTVLEDRKGISIYGSTWYSVLLVLVGLNLLVCSVNRFGLVWRRFAHPDVVVPPQQIAGMATSETLPVTGTVEAAASAAVNALKARRYQVQSQATTDGVAVYAVKNRAGFWGAHVTHLSLLVIFAGAIWGHLLGFDGYTTIDENGRTASYFPPQARTVEERKPLGFELALKSFTIKHDAKHNPVGYKSDLQVFDGGAPVAHKVIDVNHPLTYKGLSFYQSSYGLRRLVMKITSPSGEVVRIPYDIHSESGPRGQEFTVGDNTLTQFKMGAKKYTILVHKLIPDYVGGSQPEGSSLPMNPAVEVMLNDRYPEYKGLDAWTQLGYLTAEQSAPYKGLTVTVEKIVSYTYLEVSRDPGLPVVYLGFGMMILGVIMSLYLTHKIVRVVLAPSKAGLGATIGTTAVQDPSNPDKDFQHLKEALAARPA